MATKPILVNMGIGPEIFPSEEMDADTAVQNVVFQVTSKLNVSYQNNFHLYHSTVH